MMPLDGVRVLDLSRLAPGPYCSMLLGDLGADVLLVESPPQFVGRRGGAAASDGSDDDPEAQRRRAYSALGRNKRSIVLNLREQDGRDVFHRLCEDVDVVLEGFRPGLVERLGADYRTVSAINPRIVYGNYPGWGSTGPMKDRGSADPTAQAFSGAVSTTGKAGGAGEFIRIYALHDFNASSYIVTTTLLGLLYRERSGKGIKMENAQVASSIAAQTSRIAEFLASGKNVLPMGSACATTVPHRSGGGCARPSTPPSFWMTPGSLPIQAG